MKLYSRFDADSVDADGVEFKADKDGGIEVPHELGVFLHNQFINGERAWEDDAERQKRIDAEEHARKSDPAYLASIVEGLADKVEAVAEKGSSKKTVKADNADVVAEDVTSN